MNQIKRQYYVEAGYDNGVYIHRIHITHRSILVSVPKPMYFTKQNIYIPQVSFFFNSCLCPIDRLYIPQSKPTFSMEVPLDFVPSIYFYCLPSFLDEAIDWALERLITQTKHQIDLVDCQHTKLTTVENIFESYKSKKSDLINEYI